MTALAAILALDPLAVAIGLGSALLQPLAIAIISGLVLAVPMALVVLPVLFALIGGIRQEVRGRGRRRHPYRATYIGSPLRLSR